MSTTYPSLEATIDAAAFTELPSTLSFDVHQQTAIDLSGNPVMVAAGPGAGKTRVVVGRILRLLAAGIPPERIAILTFTNKAAKEFIGRVLALHPNLAGRFPFAGTIHGFCAQLLRKSPALFDAKPEWTILNPDDQEALLKEIRDDLDLSRSVDVKDVVALLDRMKRDIRDYAQVRDEIVDTARRSSRADYDTILDQLDIVRSYHMRLRQSNSFDFAELIYNAVDVLESHAKTRGVVQDMFDAMIVDEAQDTDGAQERLIRVIAGEPRIAKELMLACDDQQSIYGWRGSRHQNMLEFKGYWTEKGYAPEVLLLNRNYRSTDAIVQVANHLISHNRGQIPRDLPDLGGVAGEVVTVLRTETDTEEVKTVAELVLRSRAALPGESVAVLARGNQTLSALERHLIQLGVPCRMLTGSDILSSRVAKDMIAWLRIIRRPSDDAAFLRVLSLAPGVGAKTRNKVTRHARIDKDQGMSYANAANEIIDIENMGDGKPLPTFLDLFDDARAYYAKIIDDDDRVSKIYNWIMSCTGYREDLEARVRDGKDSQRSLEILTDLLPGFLMQQTDLSSFLDALALAGADDNISLDPNAVVLSTIHGAKGMEFDTVFLIGWTAGAFPHDDEEDMEESRRLAFVGITRAAKRAVITYSETYYGSKPGGPNRFIREIQDAKDADGARLVETMA